MDEFVGKTVDRRVEEKMQEVEVRCQQRQKGMKKRPFLDEYADDYCFRIIVGIQGVTGKRLARVQFILVDGDFIVILAAKRIVLALVGIVEKEKVMPVKKLLNAVALVHAYDDLF